MSPRPKQAKCLRHADIAERFEAMADVLAMQSANPFRARAYQNADPFRPHPRQLYRRKGEWRRLSRHILNTMPIDRVLKRLRRKADAELLAWRRADQ